MTPKRTSEAEFYQAHKDDDAVWDEPREPVPAPRRAGLTATITVRFSAEEVDAIRRIAKASNRTYSDVVRLAVQQLTQPRFTIEHGVVHRPLADYSDIRHAAEQLLETTISRQPDSVTGVSSEPAPVRG